MRVTISDARESPIAAAILLVGVAAAVTAFVVGDGEFGAPVGSPEFLLGLGAAAVAVLVSVAYGQRA
jgi:hypothetical protein